MMTSSNIRRMSMVIDEADHRWSQACSESVGSRSPKSALFYCTQHFYSEVWSPQKCSFGLYNALIVHCVLLWSILHCVVCCSLITVGSALQNLYHFKSSGGSILFSSIVCLSRLCILHVLTQVTWGPTPLLTYLIPILYFVFRILYFARLDPGHLGAHSTSDVLSDWLEMESREQGSYILVCFILLPSLVLWSMVEYGMVGTSIVWYDWSVCNTASWFS